MAFQTDGRAIQVFGELRHPMANNGGRFEVAPTNQTPSGLIDSVARFFPSSSNKIET